MKTSQYFSRKIKVTDLQAPLLELSDEETSNVVGGVSANLQSNVVGVSANLGEAKLEFTFVESRNPVSYLFFTVEED
ncbi:hypothetical protein [Nostoc sp. DedQUE09]|uniref:hypothetical protein n=1 Tax=Nostoc sp. DedQUE09 TaxID=3075394 RepID=UPI002AD335E3|nr:hypothetical protein [Nostoc sp. DedQUE09]MDZ7950714.1 hypothetical protein [Nostoc sp. DedQUE09]